MATNMAKSKKTAMSPNGPALVHGVKMPEKIFPLKYYVDESTGAPKKSEYSLFKEHNDFLRLMKTWDRGSKSVRHAILKDFIALNAGKSAPELERELSGGGSLFLTRISAWLRLTYLLGYNIAIQIQAINVFISAANGAAFLDEFLEIGGVFTLLEILTIQQTKEIDKAESMHLLKDVAVYGVKYREYICECFGVRAITEYLAKCKADAGSEYGKDTLILLASDMPRYLPQIHKSMVSILSTNNVQPKTLQLCCEGLRELLPKIDNVHSLIVESTVNLLRSFFYEVQYEAIELLKELIKRNELQEPILAALITKLKTTAEHPVHTEETKREESWANEKFVKNDLVLASYTQQANCAKLLGILSVTSADFAEKMIDLGCISGLLSAISNLNHPESQKYAVDTLLHLIEVYPRVARTIKDDVGDDFFNEMTQKPDTFYTTLTREQIKYLNKNGIKIKGSNGGLASQSSIATLGEDERNRGSQNLLDEKKPSETMAETQQEDTPEFQAPVVDLKQRSLYVPYSINNTHSTLIGERYKEDAADGEGDELAKVEFAREREKKKIAASTKDTNYTLALNALKSEVPQIQKNQTPKFIQEVDLNNLYDLKSKLTRSTQSLDQLNDQAQNVDGNSLPAK